MKRILRGLAALSALSALSALASLSLLATAPAQAQSLTNPEQWTVKLGVSMPSEGLAKDIESTWLAGGLEYSLGNTNARRINSVEAIFTTANDKISAGDEAEAEATFNMLSLMVNHRIRSFGPAGDMGSVLYYGAGIGAQMIWADIDDPNPDGFGTFDDSRTFGGANVFIGYEFAANFQLEAKYQFVFGKVADQSLDSLQLLAGFKF